MARYILGFDIGHGQCSAAKHDIDENCTIDLSIGPRGRLINSRMLKDEKGKWIVDPNETQISNAVTTIINQPKGNLTISYDNSIKEPIPSGNDKKAAEICNKMKIFLKELFKQFDLINRNIIPNSEYELYFACPSAWTNREVADYQYVINTALQEFLSESSSNTQKKVTVIKESDAAYIASRKDWKDYNLNADSHVLVIDFGSSTIDFTWFGNNEVVPYGDRNQIGAHMVEEILFNHFKNQEGLSLRAYEEISEKIGPENAKNLIVDLLREKKEYFFSQINARNPVNFPCIWLGSYIASLNASIFGPTQAEEYTIDKINAILSSTDDNLSDKKALINGQNYIGQVRNLFEEVKEKITRHNVGKDSRIDAILITGGASRMPFVQQVAKEVFGDNTTIIKGKEEDCDFVVSRGTAIWGRYHALAQPTIDEIHNRLLEDWGICKDPNNENNLIISVTSELIKKMIDKLNEIVKEVYINYINHILSSWADPNNDRYSYRKGHNLTTLLSNLQSEQYKDYWANLHTDLNKDENLLNGRRSIHSLLRGIYDCIDGNDNVLTEINKNINEKLKENIKGQIVSLLEQYYQVYFGENAQIPNSLLEEVNAANAETGIQIKFTSQEKNELFSELINKSIDYINSHGYVWTSRSFNKDRINNRWGPHVQEIQDILKDSLNDFAGGVTPDKFDGNIIKDLLVYYDNILVKAFLDIRKICEGSLFTPNSTTSQTLFGEYETTN